ncbi:MAG: hypothetical protein ACRD1X_19995 [Vicinamibacteria bacterium]
MKEFKTDHKKHMKTAMDDLIASGTEGGFVIFETDDGKFLQFTYNKGEGLTFDLPRVNMSPQEQQRLKGLEGLEAITETELSYLLQIGVDTKMGAQLADRIFRDVFQCGSGYRVVATLDIETAE